MNTEDYKKQIVDALAEGLSSGKIQAPQITLGDYVEKKIIVESGGIAEQNNYYGCNKPSDADEDSESVQQPVAKSTTTDSENQLEDSVVYLENKQDGKTMEICKSKVKSVFCSCGSKKEVLEELFRFHGRYVNLFNLGQEERVEWLNSIPSKFQGKFNKSDLKYYHEQDDDDLKRRNRS